MIDYDIHDGLGTLLTEEDIEYFHEEFDVTKELEELAESPQYSLLKMVFLGNAITGRERWAVAITRLFSSRSISSEPKVISMIPATNQEAKQFTQFLQTYFGRDTDLEWSSFSTKHLRYIVGGSID